MLDAEVFIVSLAYNVRGFCSRPRFIFCAAVAIGFVQIECRVFHTQQQQQQQHRTVTKKTCIFVCMGYIQFTATVTYGLAGYIHICLICWAVGSAFCIGKQTTQSPYDNETNHTISHKPSFIEYTTSTYSY